MMLIASRNGIIGNGLPYDSQIEYLESTGTQVIDTQYTNQSIETIRIDTSFEQTTFNTTFGVVFLSRGTSNGVLGMVIQKISLGYVYNYCWTSQQSQLPRLTYQNGVNEYSIWNDSTYSHALLNDTQRDYAVSGPQALTSSIKLFYDDGSNYGTGRIYSWKLYANAIIIRDFIPVRVGQTGYMYDKVSKRLFGNSGTGSFILGPDKVGGGGGG